MLAHQHVDIGQHGLGTPGGFGRWLKLCVGWGRTANIWEERYHTLAAQYVSTEAPPRGTSGGVVRTKTTARCRHRTHSTTLGIATWTAVYSGYVLVYGDDVLAVARNALSEASAMALQSRCDRFVIGTQAAQWVRRMEGCPAGGAPPHGAYTLLGARSRLGTPSSNTTCLQYAE